MNFCEIGGRTPPSYRFIEIERKKEKKKKEIERGKKKETKKKRGGEEEEEGETAQASKGKTKKCSIK